MFEHKEAGYKKILIELLLRIFGNAFIEQTFYTSVD